MKKLAGIFVLTLGPLLGACDRDKSTAHLDAAPHGLEHLTVSLVEIAPGGGKPVHVRSEEAKKFDGHADQIAAGHQLFQAYNCVGCHFNGGGGIGPPLMDDKWIYGSSMENIASTTREGRPNGMPSFRSMVTDDQVWQLAAYVRSLSGLGSKESK